ncbi:MAG: hypothetical protein D6748_08725 [Calditrichaeota bacterium]|nr:MAG: hypothetical protein D6748_08725 [Calditrichota bacterium]
MKDRSTHPCNVHPNFPLKKRLAVVLAVLFVWFVTVSCSVKEPVLPSWSVPLNVPLSEEVFVLGEELINDSTIIVQGADSVIYLSLDGSLEPLEISPTDFSFEETDTSFSFMLDTLELNNLDPLNTGLLTLGEIYPELYNLVSGGQSIPFTMPETTLVTPSVSLPTDDFRSIHIVDGNLVFQFTNDLPFPVGPNSSHPAGIEITFRDSLQQVVATVTVGQVLNPGENVIQTVPIVSNSWVYSPMEVSFILPIAQETTFTLNESVLNTSGLSTEITLENIRVDEAIARVEPQEIEKTYAIELSNENALREAVIAQGAIEVQFNNQTPVGAQVIYEIPNILTPQNTSFRDSVVVEPGNVTHRVVVLNGMRITTAQEGEGYIDSLKVGYFTRTETANDFIHIRATDEVSIQVRVDSLTFQSFSGYIAGEEFTLEPYTINDIMEYDNIPDNILLNNVELALTLRNEIWIENLFLNLTITGYHEDENGVVTDSSKLYLLNHQVMPGTPGNPGITTITLTGEDVVNFLNTLPTSIRTEGYASLSGDVIIAGESRVEGDYVFSTPLRFEISEPAFLKGDVQVIQEDDVDSQIKDAEDGAFQEAHLTLELTNGTPVGGSIRLIVSADPQHQDLFDSTYFNPQLEFRKEVVVQPAPTDPLTGFVTTPTVNTIDLSLTAEEFRLFKNPPLRIGYELGVAQTDGVVAIRASDFVKVSGIARVVVMVNQ